MFLKMTGKLLFKACIPLVIVAGISTYVMSQRGVDPVLMWKGIGSGVMNQFASLFSNVKDDASKAADAVAGVTSGLSTESPSKRTKVFTWKDAEGVTHYSTVAPTHTDARSMRINPNQNVVSPIVDPKAVKTRQAEGVADNAEEGHNDLSPSDKRRDRQEREREGKESYGDSRLQDVADQLDGELPGMAGQVLSGQSADSVGTLNPSNLLKMLK